MQQPALFAEAIKAPPTRQEILKMVYPNGQDNPAEIVFYEDPGHGWLQVPLATIKALKIKPSQYSYKDSKYAYLEEDCDLSLYAKATGLENSIKDFWEIVPTEYENYDSKIRQKSRY